MHDRLPRKGICLESRDVLNFGKERIISQKRCKIYKDTCKCIFCLGAPACLDVFGYFKEINDDDKDIAAMEV